MPPTQPMIFSGLTPGMSVLVVNIAAAAPARKEPSFCAKMADITLGALTTPSIMPNLTSGKSGACWAMISWSWVLHPKTRSYPSEAMATRLDSQSDGTLDSSTFTSTPNSFIARSSPS